MVKIRLDRKKLEKQIKEAGNITVWTDKKWNYPNTGDDFKTCPMLELMMAGVEHNDATVIVITNDSPYLRAAKAQGKRRAMSSEDFKK